MGRLFFLFDNFKNSTLGQVAFNFCSVYNLNYEYNPKITKIFRV